jgi:nucleoside-diphosphate-sugar epimerase
LNILVTGCAGYIGAQLIPHLLADGHNVRGIDTEWFGSGHLPESNDSFDFVRGDLRDQGLHKSLWKGLDVVLHLASVSNNALCELNPVFHHENNMIATLACTEHAVKYKVPRFIFASSVAAYGTCEEATEDTVLKPTTLYGYGKSSGEGFLKNRGSDMAWTVVRAATVSGPSAKMRFDTTLNKMTHDAVRHGVIKVNGGSQKRSHVSLQDTCDFYRMLVNKDINGVFNLVECNQTVLESAQMVAEVTGAKVEVGPSTDNRSYTVSGMKVKELGFEMKHGIKAAVHHLAARLKAGYWKNSESDVRLWNMRYDLI